MIMDKKELLLSSYEITDDQNITRKIHPIPPELDEQLDDLYQHASKGKRSAVKKLIRLIEKYPGVPVLKNYLSALYSNLGQMEKALELNHRIVAEHPDYLYGKLNLAAEYFMKDEFDKIPGVLGKSMELKELCPDRDTFHISEASGFFKIAILYFSAIGDLEEAEMRLDILRELDPGSENLAEAEEYFQKAELYEFLNRKLEEKKDSINVEVKKTALTEIKSPPEFTHEQINQLYENDFSVDEDIISEIINLPRKSLIEDLNKLLEDSIIRYNHFNTKVDEGEFDEKHTLFVIHALFILSEIEAAESLENILEVLRQDIDYFNLFFGDILTEYIWLVLYKTAASQLDVCKRFMFEPGIYLYSKAAISDMVNQIVQHHPERRNEVIEWYRDVFRFFLDSSLDDNVIDSDLLGILVNDVLDFKGIELLPEIEELYKKEIVDLYACGDIDEVKKHFSDKSEISYKSDVISIFEVYDEIQSWNTGEDPGDYDDHSDYVREEIKSSDHSLEEQPVKVGKKIGRNDPCPCGSGKKYKKCCMNK